MKTIKFFLLLGISLTILGCSKSKDDADDALKTLNALECVKLLKKISGDDRNRNCSEKRSDIESIEKKCGKFLDAEQKESLALAKELCEDN